MSKQLEKILIIVPAYNESESICKVIDSLMECKAGDVLIINDCSRDDTSQIAQNHGHCTVVDLPNNLGIGGAVQTGLKYAARHNYNYAVKFDGDGQHIASEIKTLLKPIQDGVADVTIGSRFCEKHDGFKSTFCRRIGIKLFEIVNSMLIGQRVTDNTSGFRAYNQKAIDFLAHYYPSFDYPEPEEVILLGRNHFKIQEMFTEMQVRQGGQSSISGFKSLYYMVKVLLSVFMVAIRPRVISNAKDE